MYVLKAFPVATPKAAEGRAIHGGALWFPSTEETRDPMRRRLLNDFHLIGDINDAPHEHEQLVASLRAGLSPGDVVVTHHGPSLLSVPTEFAGSIVNCFFTTDLEELIRTLKPAIWVHGHAHNPLDYRVGETRVYANPLGYPGEGSNSDFWQRVEIELQSGGSGGGWPLCWRKGGVESISTRYCGEPLRESSPGEDAAVEQE